MAHHSAGLGVVLPNVGHRARPVQVGIHRERLHFGNHHIEIPTCALDTHHREQKVGQVLDVEPRPAGNSKPVAFHISQGSVAKPRQNTLPPSSARFRGSSRRRAGSQRLFWPGASARNVPWLCCLCMSMIPYSDCFHGAKIHKIIHIQKSFSPMSEKVRTFAVV